MAPRHVVRRERHGRTGNGGRSRQRQPARDDDGACRAIGNRAGADVFDGDLADKARRVLDGYAGQIENTVVEQATLEDEFDDLVEVEGSEESLYVVRQTYDVFWQEN